MLPLLLLLFTSNVVTSALLVNDRGAVVKRHKAPSQFGDSRSRSSRTVLRALDEMNRDDLTSFSTLPRNQNNEEIQGDQANFESTEQGQAAINTINERLMAELEEARNKEKFGSRSGNKRFRFELRPPKSEEERQAAIEEARNLNGVNPVVTIIGSMVALAMAGGLWYATNYLGEFFAMHPVESELYIVERIAAVFRNVVIGIVSLASGFFGVTGMGIFMLGVRVAYGVMTGELDPTPIKKTRTDEIVMPNVWNLMLNKRPSRRGNKDGNDNNPFGI